MVNFISHLIEKKRWQDVFFYGIREIVFIVYVKQVASIIRQQSVTFNANILGAVVSKVSAN